MEPDAWRKRAFYSSALLILPASGFAGEHGTSFPERLLKLLGLGQKLTRRTRFTSYAASAIFTIEAVFAPDFNFDDLPRIWLLCLSLQPGNTSFASRTNYLTAIPINLELPSLKTALARDCQLELMRVGPKSSIPYLSALCTNQSRSIKPATSERRDGDKTF